MDARRPAALLLLKLRPQVAWAAHVIFIDAGGFANTWFVKHGDTCEASGNGEPHRTRHASQQEYQIDRANESRMFTMRQNGRIQGGGDTWSFEPDRCPLH
jgi:hypothetical protein